MWKGLLKILTAIVHGLEASVAATSGNMCTASAFRALEMAHTHYWTRLELGDSDPKVVERGSEVAEVTSSTLSTPVASSTVRATAIRAWWVTNNRWRHIRRIPRDSDCSLVLGWVRIESASFASVGG